jgi:cation transport ATPase
MSIFEKAINSAQYQLSQAFVDPAAEKYAKEQAEKAQKETDLKKKEADTKAAKAKKEAEEKKKKEEADKIRKEKESRNTFSFTRLFGTVFGTFMTIFLVFLLFFCGVLGASFATNLNLYRSWPFRVFYAFYGFLFFFIVIPYVLGYRWFWKGLKPKFYSLLPMIPYHLDNRFTAFLFSWLSYKPDDEIDSLKEWIKEGGPEGP